MVHQCFWKAYLYGIHTTNVLRCIYSEEHFLKVWSESRSERKSCSSSVDTDILLKISQHVNFFVGGFSLVLTCQTCWKSGFWSQIHTISALIIFFICRPNPRDWGDFLLVWILLPEGPESDEIFDQTQKPNKGPSIRRAEHHIGHTGGYKEIKKAATNKWKKAKLGHLKSLCLFATSWTSVCLCFGSPGWRACWLPEEEVAIVNLCGPWKAEHKMCSLTSVIIWRLGMDLSTCVSFTAVMFLLRSQNQVGVYFKTRWFFGSLEDFH